MIYYPILMKFHISFQEKCNNYFTFFCKRHITYYANIVYLLEGTGKGIVGSKEEWCPEQHFIAKKMRMKPDKENYLNLSRLLYTPYK